MNHNRTALVIFAHDAEVDTQNKHLFAGNRKKNLQVFKALNQRVQQTAKATGLTYFTVGSRLQKGDSFVERYYRAIESIFDKGYEQVVIVGNDSPELEAQTLLKVVDQIESGQHIVYGPTNRGGIYTLGLSREGFQMLNFEELPWQSESLLGAFDELLLNNSNVFRLNQVLCEFNKTSDILSFLTYPTTLKSLRAFYNLLFGFYFDQHIPVFTTIAEVDEFFAYDFSRRGPPRILNRYYS